jgi:Transcription-silencing protein, cryptic loci regulator Clr2
MSVPIYSDGVEEVARIAMTTQGWLQADEFITSFFSTISKQIAELCSVYAKNLKPSKKQQFDLHGKPIYNELPQNYILANDPSSSTFAIVGHPSGLHFQTAKQFLPHLHWLCNPERFRAPCGCSLCLYV